MCKFVPKCVLLLLWFYSFVNCARILVYIPTPSVSHQILFRPLTQELAKRGHQVIVITTDPAFAEGQVLENLTEIDLHDISYANWYKFVDKSSGNKGDIYEHMRLCHEEVTKVVELQLRSNEVQKIINEKEKIFDLLLLEEWVRPSLVFTHLIKAPVISISSLGSLYGDYTGLGVPMHPILYPPVLSLWTYNLTLWDKIQHLYSYIRIQLMYKNHRKTEDDMLRRIFGPSIPNIAELTKNIDLYLINMHPIWGLNIPVPPNVIHIGGIQNVLPKKLPKDLQSFLDSSKNGVIYMSLGTNVKTSLLPKETLNMIIKVLSEQPYQVLLKYDEAELLNKPKNIKIAKWFPQPDVLSHPNIKLFITQGGLQSTDEAIIAGVPLIGFPMLADQWYNVDQYERHSIGIRIDMDSITEEKFRDAIREVTETEKYRNNIIKLRTIMYDQPQPALERAVWWIEHVLRHGGGKHLRSPAANISWAEFLEIELVLILFSTILALLAVFGISVYCLLKSAKSQLLTSRKLKNN